METWGKLLFMVVSQILILLIQFSRTSQNEQRRCTLLASLENLTSLNLSQNERITNRGAAALAALSNLKSLNLSNTRVNANALKFLGGLLKLQSLALYGCRGIDTEDGSLMTLQNGLPSLKCLRLNNTLADDGAMTGAVADESEESDSDEEEEVNLISHRRAYMRPRAGSSSSEDSGGDMDEDASFYSDHD